MLYSLPECSLTLLILFFWSKYGKIYFFVVQLYVPPEKMLNKDFLKKVLKEEKKLLSLKEVKYVNVPHYEELSVKRFWPILR